MIKINLANSLMSKSGLKTSSAQINPKEVATRAALLLLPVLCIFIWEKRSLSQKEEQLSTLQVQAAALSKELDGFGSIDDMVRSVNEQKKDLDEKFNVMRQIFGLRSQKLQTLIALQEKIPSNAWLTQVLFHEKTVSVIGYAKSIEDTQNFAGGLTQNTDIFASVNTTNTSSEKVQGGEYFKFDIFIKLKE